MKLAFGLNTTSFDHIIDIKTIDKHPIVIAISNIQSIDEAFLGGLPIRVKQTHDFGVVSAFKVIEDSVQKKLNIFGKIASHVDARTGFYDEIIDASRSLTNTGDPLVSLETIKLSKNSVLAGYQRISAEFRMMKTEHVGILSGAYDATCISQFEVFDQKLSGMIEGLFNSID